MADFSTFGSKGRSRRQRKQPNATINVAPLVDVMLVLLIVFMVSAPLLTGGIPLDLPQAEAPAVLSDQEPLSISIDKDGQIFFGEEAVEKANLAQVLDTATDGDKSRKLFLRGDKGVLYADLVQLLSVLTAAGYTKLSLVAEQEG